MRHSQLKKLIIGFAAIITFTSAVNATSFPNRPITMVVPFTPAGPTDALARTLAASMQEALKESIVVDNRPGAAGNIGSSYVARAKADGYTLLFASSGPLLINTSLFKNPGFDPIHDFTPLFYVGEIPNVLVVNAKLPVNDLKELKNYIQQHSNLSYASSGVGSTNHLLAAKFNNDLQANLAHIPYKGTAPALNDLLGGQVTTMFLDVLTAAPHIESGRLKALGVASEKRSYVLPNVPTFDEQQIPSINRGVAFGLLAPAQLGNEQREVLKDAALMAFQSPAMQEALSRQGVEINSQITSDIFPEFIKDQIKVWSDVITLTGATLD